jgi:hypothetical protein
MTHMGRTLLFDAADFDSGFLTLSVLAIRQGQKQGQEPKSTASDKSVRPTRASLPLNCISL